MLERGLVREVEGLVARFGSELRPLGCVGYLQTLEHLQGSAPRDELQQRLVQATRAYARRQRTWAKTDPDITVRVTPAEARNAATLERIRKHLAR